MGRVRGRPDWWRGERKPRTPASGPSVRVQSGRLTELSPDPPDSTGLRMLHLFDAEVHQAQLDLSEVRLAVEWSIVEDCTFRQKVKPVLNQHGIAAQGCFGNRPALYRGCRFERVRFKILGGFNDGRATFEDCEFVDCRWEGHFAQKGWWIDNRFTGRMNGCVWFGRDPDGHPNTVRGNDFTGTRFTDNVAFRADYPVADQRWTYGFVPTVDD